MLRKLLVAIICLPFALAGHAAQLTATLQSGDKLIPFYGTGAFKEAYEAAADGDVITLSTGEFNTVKIEKSISVIGTYAFHEDAAKATTIWELTVSSDNVTLEGIRFKSYLLIEGADNLFISRCWINQLEDKRKEGHEIHDNTIVTDCRIILCGSMEFSKNAVFRNSNISYFTDINKSENLALIENCNIPWFNYTQGTGYSFYNPYAVYRNCLLGIYNSSGTAKIVYTLSSPSEFHNNIFILSHSHKWTNYPWEINYSNVIAENNPTVNKFGIDSNEVDGSSSMEAYEHEGKKYGPIDHKDYPAVPEITSVEIDTQTNAEGKLHVKITAVARN